MHMYVIIAKVYENCHTFMKKLYSQRIKHGKIGVYENKFNGKRGMKMNRIGIIGAMEIEVEQLKERMETIQFR